MSEELVNKFLAKKFPDKNIPNIDDIKKHVIGHTYNELGDITEKFAKELGYEPDIAFNIATKDKSQITNLVYEITKNLHYDNGQPLTNEYWNYFDHYDRDQDLYEYGLNIPIIDIVMIGLDPYYIINVTDQDIKNSVKADLDNSSWEHDFGKVTPDEVIAKQI